MEDNGKLRELAGAELDHVAGGLETGISGFYSGTGPGVIWAQRASESSAGSNGGASSYLQDPGALVPGIRGASCSHTLFGFGLPVIPLA